jgi:sialate O-acetylesterase
MQYKMATQQNSLAANPVAELNNTDQKERRDHTRTCFTAILCQLVVIFAVYTVVVASACAGEKAELALAPVFSDRMVLQRGTLAPIWGRTTPGASVVVRIAEKDANTTADANGDWLIRLDTRPLAARSGYELKVTSGNNSIALHDVAVGDVWVASGQSNMYFPLDNSRPGVPFPNPTLQVDDFKQEITAANAPDIRWFDVKPVQPETPQPNLPGAQGCWQTVSPQTAAGMTAVGYYFARDLQQSLKVPIGILHSTYPGSKVQSWTRRAVWEADPILSQRVKGALEETGMQTAFRMWNGMIAPLIPYAITGVIWYQGETDADRDVPEGYAHRFQSMIRDWRAQWGQGDFPFLWVQLPGSGHPSQQLMPDGNLNWPVLRAEQAAALQLPRTGMAVTFDQGDPSNGHPPHKREIGRRLAQIALVKVYNQPGAGSGPVFAEQKREGNKLRLRFTDVGSGLVAADRVAGCRFVGTWGKGVLASLAAAKLVDVPDRVLTFGEVRGLLDKMQLPEPPPAGIDPIQVKALRKTLETDPVFADPKLPPIRKPAPGTPLALEGFAICGADGKWEWADAEIDGDCVVVSNPNINEPVAASYAWDNMPRGNLINREGLWAVPFRTDRKK